MLDSTELNFSPVRGRPGVHFVSTPAELARALQSTSVNSHEHRNTDEFFFLAADLHRWKRLLGLDPAGTQ
jgi:hypothetical protein